MRIEGPGRTQGTGGAKKARGAGKGPAFSIENDGETTKAGAASGAGAVTGIDAILALQAVEDPLFAKRKTVKRGQSILDTLEEMKADLLAGRVDGAQIARLTALLKQARGLSDPRLDALIDDIELRAQVELAKLGHFPQL